MLPSEQPRRSRALIFGLGAAGLAAVLAVVLVLALGRGGSGQGGSDSGPTGPASPTGSMVAAGQTEPPAGSGEGSSTQGGARVVSLHPSRVVIRLADLPAEAICRLEGRVVKGNPLVLDRSEGQVTLICEAKGRRSYTQSFTPDRDLELKVSMEFEAGRGVSGTRTGGRTMARPVKDPMTQPRKRPEPARPPPEMRPPRPMAQDVLID